MLGFSKNDSSIFPHPNQVPQFFDYYVHFGKYDDNSRKHYLWIRDVHNVQSRETQKFSIKHFGCSPIQDAGSLLSIFFNNILKLFISNCRTLLNEVTQELAERVHRWKKIEALCGFNIINNRGLDALATELYKGVNGRGLSIKSKRSVNKFFQLFVNPYFDEGIAAVFAELLSQFWRFHAEGIDFLVATGFLARFCLLMLRNVQKPFISDLFKIKGCMLLHNPQSIRFRDILLV